MLGLRLDRRSGSHVGAALGAARLARLARSGEPVEAVCVPPPLTDSFAPDAARHAALAERHARFQRLYGALRAEMQPG
ncbi:Xylulose kinase [compost metagenome]